MCWVSSRRWPWTHDVWSLDPKHYESGSQTLSSRPPPPRSPTKCEWTKLKHHVECRSDVLEPSRGPAQNRSLALSATVHPTATLQNRRVCALLLAGQESYYKKFCTPKKVALPCFASLWFVFLCFVYFASLYLRWLWQNWSKREISCSCLLESRDLNSTTIKPARCFWCRWKTSGQLKVTATQHEILVLLVLFALFDLLWLIYVFWCPAGGVAGKRGHYVATIVIKHPDVGVFSWWCARALFVLVVYSWWCTCVVSVVFVCCLCVVFVVFVCLLLSIPISWKTSLERSVSGLTRPAPTITS